MLGDHGFDLGRVDIGAAADDHVRAPAHQAQEASFVERAKVTWIGPTVFERIA